MGGGVRVCVLVGGGGEVCGFNSLHPSEINRRCVGRGRGE